MDSNNSDQPEFYALLNVTQEATSAEIRAAFLNLSLQYHPDKGRFSPTTSHKKFILLREAYETLMDPTRRMQYDYQFPPYKPAPKPSYDLQQRYKLMDLDKFEVLLGNLDCAFNRFRQLACTRSSNPFGLPRNHYFEKLSTEIATEKHNIRAWQARLRAAVYNFSTQIGIDEHSEFTRTHQRLVNWIKTLTRNLNNICSHYYRLQRLRSWALLIGSPAINVEKRGRESKFKVLISNYLRNYNR